MRACAAVGMAPNICLVALAISVGVVAEYAKLDDVAQLVRFAGIDVDK